MTTGSPLHTKRNFFARMMYGYLGKIGMYLFQAAALFLLAKFLSTEDFGRFNVLVSAVLTGALIIDFGIPSFLLRFAGEYIEHNDYARSAGILRTLINAVGILEIAMLGVFAAVVFPTGLYKNQLCWYVAIIALFAGLRFLCVVTEIYLSSLYREYYKNVVIVVVSFARLCGIAAVLLWKMPFIMLFSVTGVTDAVEILACYGPLRASLLSKTPPHYFKESIAELLDKKIFIVREYAFKLLGFLWEFRFDLFVALSFLGLRQTGSYAFAMGVSALVSVWAPDTVLQPVLRSFMVRQYVAKNDRKGLERFFRISTTFKIFLMFPAIVTLTILLQPLARVLFADKYTQGVNIFFIFAPFLIFKTLISPVREVLLVVNRNDIPLRSNFALLYKAAAIFILVPFFGASALAFASGSFFLLVLLIQCWMGRKAITLTFEWGKVLKIAVNSAIMACIGIALLSRGPLRGAYIVSVAVVMGVAYLAASRVNRVFTSEERRLVREMTGLTTVWL